jgi:transposase
MWGPYIAPTHTHVPDAGEKIVFDKFHTAKHLHEVVDKVRRLEARLLRRAGDGSAGGHQIAGLEAVNAMIQWVKRTARGFRNAENFKMAIYFHCGGLDLYPHESR